MEGIVLHRSKNRLQGLGAESSVSASTNVHGVIVVKKHSACFSARFFMAWQKATLAGNTAYAEAH